jgi:ABC-2 type transport system permease protein
MLKLLWHELFTRRWEILGWGIGLSGFAWMYLGLYPSMQDQMAAFDLSEIAFYEAIGVTDMVSFEGYAAGTVVNLLPIILAVYAITTSTWALAGEEDAGTLEMLVTLPLPRWQIVLTKALGIALALLLICLLAAVGAMSVFAFIASDITTIIEQPTAWIPIMLSAWPLTLAFGFAAFAFGAITPSRSVANMFGTIFFLGSYIGKAVTSMTTDYEALRPLFLFHYYDNTRAVFTDGINLGNQAILLTVALVFLALTLLAFQRRNLTVGRWVWR